MAPGNGAGHVVRGCDRTYHWEPIGATHCTRQQLPPDWKVAQKIDPAWIVA